MTPETAHQHAFLALPVEDHKPNETSLSAQCFETLQKLAYLAASHANKLGADAKPTIFKDNKLIYSSAQLCTLKADHVCAAGKQRNGYQFTRPNGDTGEDFFLGIPTVEEGMPQANQGLTFDEYMKKISRDPCIGGNVSNTALNAVMMTEALKDIFPEIQLIIATPTGTRLAEMLKERKERVGEWLKILELEMSHSRAGLHIPIDFLHNLKENKKQTIMFNSEGPTVAEIVKAIEGCRDKLEACMLYSGNDHYELNGAGGTRLMPTTASRKDLTLKPRRVLILNGEEFAEVMNNSGGNKGECDLKSITRADGSIDDAAFAITNKALLQATKGLHSNEGSTDDRDQKSKRIAQIGMSNGTVLDTFVVGNEVICMETSAVDENQIDHIISLAASEKISRNNTDATGRGDAAAAATILDDCDPTTLLTWWKELHRDQNDVQLNEKSLQLLQMVLPSVMSRLNVKLKHYCNDSNLFEAIDAEGYRRVLDLGMSISLTLVQKLEGEINTEPRILRDDVSNMTTTVWKTAL